MSLDNSPQSELGLCVLRTPTDKLAEQRIFTIVFSLDVQDNSGYPDFIPDFHSENEQFLVVAMSENDVCNDTFGIFLNRSKWLLVQ